MQLKLKKIRWKNFLSTGNLGTEIDLCGSPTTLIVGKNGSGKSTLLDALFFALFNRAFRNITKPQLVNTITNADCMVELEFEINGYDFKVVRGIKPNIFEIYRNGELITQAADNRDYQQAFEKYILKVTHKTFSQIVVLGSAIYTPFMALPTPKRREIIEDLLDLEIFSRMNVLLKGKLDQSNFDISESEHSKLLATEKIRLSEENLERFKTSKQQLVADHQKNLNNILDQLAGLFSVIDNLEAVEKSLADAIKPLPQVQKTYHEVATIRAELAQTQRRLNKDLMFFANNNVCPTCHQNIDTTFKEHYVTEHQAKSDEVSSAVTKLDEKMVSLSSKIAELEQIRTDRAKNKNKLIEKQTERDSLQRQSGELQTTIEQVNQESYEVDFAKLEELKMELEQVQNVLITMNDDRTIMGYAAVLLKDNGIKARIIASFLPVINQLINKYLAELDFFVEFNLNEEFNETILSRHRDAFSYESFSQGEKLRLDLGMLFTWRAIAKLRSSINCNLLVFDELLDSALDTEGIDDILKVIGNLTIDDNVIIISHREDQISDRFSKIIRFTKTQNFSKVTE